MSSAYKNSSYLTACGMSFIYRRNRSWSKIDPCWTRHKSYPGSEKDSFKFTLNFLYDKYDLNQRMTSLENPKNSILLIRISRLIVLSNAFWRSMSIIPVWRPHSKPVAILLSGYERHKSVEKCFLNPDWNLSSILFPSRDACVWSWTTFSIILDIKGSNEIGR